VQCELAAQASSSQHALADCVRQHGHLHLLEHVLVAALGEGVLAPAGDEASAAGKVLPVVGQADGADVRTGDEGENCAE